MFLAKLAIERPIMTTMGILVFIIFGALAYFGINLNNMPDVEIPYVSVQTIYPGAGPKEIETLITKKIEDQIATVSEIETIQSFSLDGASIVIVEFKLSKDVDVANTEVKDKVDQILNDLPDDAEDPIIQKIDIRAFPIMSLVLAGDLDPRELYEFADKTLKDKLSQIQGVAQVDISGGQERAVRVELDDKIVFENKISLLNLVSILQAQNMKLPGGYFQIGDQEYTVRVDGEFDAVSKMNRLQIPTMYGNKLLGQIADVKDAGKDVRERAIYFNNVEKVQDPNVVKLDIIKSTDGNVVKVAQAVNEALPEINKQLPEGAQLIMITDDSKFTESSVNDTLSNIILGIVFTSIVLFIFLGNIRSTFIVALSMPTSIIATFMLLDAANLSLNIMTLMGLSVSVGVLVANSVVVLENIFRHKSLGKDNKSAALVGTTEVTVAVIASTLTNLVVFLPIASMTSMVGRFLTEFALSASFATIFSLVFSFTLTPMLASLILPKKQKQSGLNRMLDGFFKKWDNAYESSLRFILQNKLTAILVIVFSFLLFIATSYFYGGSLAFEFMPERDEGKIKLEVELPTGYNLTETANTLQKIEDQVKQYPEVEHIITNLGKISDLNTGTNTAVVTVRLFEFSKRPVIEELGRYKKTTELIQDMVRDLADIPNAKILVASDNNGGGGGWPIQFDLQGQDLDVLEEYKQMIVDSLKDVPGLINFDNTSREGKPEITIIPKREILAETGVTAQEIALTVRAAVEGLEASVYREDGEEYDIIVTLNDGSVDSPEKIGNIPIVSQKGELFRVSQLADVTKTEGYTKILHYNKYTSIQFTASFSPEVPMGNVTAEMERRLQNIDFPTGYKYEWGGQSKMMTEMVLDFGFALLLAIMLTYMLLAAILESFIQPVFILITLPLAFIGVFVSLYYMNVSLGLTALMAVLMLLGIVVNNAILMLDYTNQLMREDGMGAKDAIIAACPTKLKPILMSSTAIILGMLPMAMGIGDAGAEMRVPMGIVSIGGLVASTVLALFVIPAFYYVAYGRKK